MKSQALLSITFLFLAGVVQGNQTQPTVRTFVVPSSIHDKQPFTFGMTAYVEGEVVDIKTVEGEVVAQHKADQHGRVFLAAGLAAGSYLLSSSGGSSGARPPVMCIVAPPAEGVVGGLLRVDNPPQSFNLRDGLNLKGGGFDPNAAHMVVELGSQSLPVLAATADEVSTGPLGPEVPCGKDSVQVRNMSSGQGAVVPDVFCYDLSSQLVRRTVASGDQTTLEFKMVPIDATCKVLARIESGPVTFAGGAKETIVDVVKGSGKAAIVSQPGSLGKFLVSWKPDGRVYDSQEVREDPAKTRRRMELYEKRRKAAEAAEAAAEKAEKAAKAAEDKRDNEKAAEERKKAADKHKEAAANYRANREAEKAADQERKAAENARKQAEEHDKAGKSQKPGKDARRDAAQAEERAAGDEQREANAAGRSGRERAAAAQDRAADGYERAAKDYRANGEGSKASDAEAAAKGARQEAERLRK